MATVRSDRRRCSLTKLMSAGKRVRRGEGRRTLPAGGMPVAALHFRQRDYEKAWADVKECQRLGLEVPPEFLAKLRKASGREE